jgi:hypothetical protein
VAAALLPAGLRASSQERSENRIDRPEGYLELVGDGGAPAGRGSFSLVPAVKRESNTPASQAAEADSSVQVLDSEDQVPPPPARATAREACQPLADRFARRLAALRGNSPDGGEALDFAVQRAMFGRTALRAASTDPDQAVPELTWDDELKDLYRGYQKCVKARR